MKKIKFEWENIKESPRLVTFRTKVFGGWVLCNCNYTDTENSNFLNENMVFIPDPNHEWEVGDE